MNWCEPIDQYCERAGPGLWAESINLTTNLAFILAAFFAWQAYRKKSRQPVPIGFLILLISTASIGIGSSLFHSFAQKWARITDVTPIAFFAIFYVGYVAKQVLRFTPPRVMGAYALLGGLTTLSLLLFDTRTTNGSSIYFGLLAFLFLMGLWSKTRAKEVAPLFYWAASLFSLALLFRSLDLYLCGVIPIGTHFLWHLLNGVVLFLLLLTLIKHDYPKR